MAGIGCPQKLVKNIENGVYEPFVSKGAKKCAAVRINLNNQATRLVNCENENGFFDSSDKDFVLGHVSSSDIKVQCLLL